MYGRSVIRRTINPLLIEKMNPLISNGMPAREKEGGWEKAALLGGKRVRFDLVT